MDWIGWHLVPSIDRSIGDNISSKKQKIPIVDSPWRIDCLLTKIFIHLQGPSVLHTTTIKHNKQNNHVLFEKGQCFDGWHG